MHSLPSCSVICTFLFRRSERQIFLEHSEFVIAKFCLRDAERARFKISTNYSRANDDEWFQVFFPSQATKHIIAPVFVNNFARLSRHPRASFVSPTTKSNEDELNHLFLVKDASPRALRGVFSRADVAELINVFSFFVHIFLWCAKY